MCAVYAYNFMRRSAPPRSCTVAFRLSMKYQSTRGGVYGVSFSEVVLSSYAPDGGLYVPETVPQVSRERLRSWAGLSYQELMPEILSLFVSQDELSRAEMQG